MMAAKRWYAAGAMIFLLCVVAETVLACTTAVVSGRITADGRPILWKNRDLAAAPRNEIAILAEGRFRAVAVVNAGSRTSVWMGANEAGFCIENSLSTDLASDQKTSGPGNGTFMKLALMSCATVEDFRQLLEQTNQSGRTTTANFGVIDGCGGAAIFETGPRSYTLFDANDPQVAPYGYVVRSNFATTAQNTSPNPVAEQLVDISSGGRYLRAWGLLNERREQQISVEYVLRHLTRDLADRDGQAIPGSVNAPEGELPAEIPTDQTISRSTTISAAVFHGVKPGEDPRLTTMWAVLGDPKFSIAVPCWPTLEQIADPLEGQHGGEIGEVARLLRDWHLTMDAKGVRSAGLPGIWEDLWPLEAKMLERTLAARQAWTEGTFSDGDLTRLHTELAALGLEAMQTEMLQAKELALGEPAVFAEEPPIRVAIYDHSDGSAKGPKNLLRFLTLENGFSARQVKPEDIREGILGQFDVLIMPGGSGSSQASRLEPSGHDAVRQFVQEGGGYVGICAGAYLASAHYSWSLGLINARVWDRSHWARGTGTVTIELSSNGQRVLQNGGSSLDVYYGQGPLLVPGTHPGLPRYEVLAVYASEIATKGAPTEAMVGTHAIVRARFGSGRVICFSPHPETATGPNHLMSAGVRWAAGRD